MYNSIIQFIKKDTKKIEKLMTEHLLSGNMLRFEEGLIDAIIEFGRELYQEVLESLEKTIWDSAFRKQNYYVEHKEDRRTLSKIQIYVDEIKHIIYNFINNI